MIHNFHLYSTGNNISHIGQYNDTVSTKIYDKRDYFDFESVNFPFLDGDVPRRPSYGVYLLKRKSFATFYNQFFLNMVHMRIFS